jgi:hypothetical protein
MAQCLEAGYWRDLELRELKPAAGLSEGIRLILGKSSGILRRVVASPASPPAVGSPHVQVEVRLRSSQLVEEGRQRYGHGAGYPAMG